MLVKCSGSQVTNLAVGSLMEQPRMAPLRNRDRAPKDGERGRAGLQCIMSESLTSKDLRLC